MFCSALQSSEDKKMTMIVRGKGRGPISPSHNHKDCLCYRPRCHVLCTNCGFHIWGRIRYGCPVHPQTMFLNDWPQCPQCRAYKSLLCEFGEATRDT